MEGNALTCVEINKPLEVLPLAVRELGDDDVEIKIHYCGVCGTDVSACGKLGATAKLPLVPGHEGIGEVVAVGKGASSVSLGDIVGVGYFRYSCSSCNVCAKGWDNLCSKRVGIFREGNTGAFGSIVRINHKYAIRIPEGIPRTHAGPLMCAGTTVFAPFVEHHISPTDRVGVVGIGGLGHLALQVASKWGCEVTAFSSSPGKETEARSFGANHFIVTSVAKQVEAAIGSCDFILMTAGGDNIDWNMLFSLLDMRGKIILMGISLKPIPCPPISLITCEKGVVGSMVGSRSVIMKMLKFCEKHQILPQIELFPATDVNVAFDKVKNNTIRYRAVLDMQV